MKQFLIFAAAGAVAWWLHHQRSGEAPRKEDNKPRSLPKAKKDRIRVEGVGPPKAQEDLKRVEGVGPKIESLLQEADIRTFSDLADASASKLRSVLDEAGPRYRMHDPSTWPRQARLAADGKWDELAAFQSELKAGRKG